MSNSNLKLGLLYLLTFFLIGMCIGGQVKFKETGTDFHGLFAMVIFAAGLSAGAFVTTLIQQFTHSKSANS